MEQCIKPAIVAIGTVMVVAALLVAQTSAAKTAKSGSFYQVEITTKATGDDVVATIRVTGKSGYGCNMLYPWKLTVIPGPGIEMTKTVFAKGDASKFTKEAVVFEVRYVARAGAGPVTAKLKLSGCDDKQCQMEQVDLSWPSR
jgi:hypothetical protein